MARKKIKTSLDVALEEGLKMTHEENMDRVRKAVEGSLRRSGVLKAKKKRNTV